MDVTKVPRPLTARPVIIKTVVFTGYNDNGGYIVQPGPIEYSVNNAKIIITNDKPVKTTEQLFRRGNIISGMATYIGIK